MAEEDYSINTGKVRSFQVADYVLFVLTLLVSAGIGVVFAIVDRRRNTPKDFLLGGKQMHVVPVSMSLTVTFMSALTLLGNPAEIYNYNTMFWYLCAAFLVALLMAAHVLIPFFYQMGITSTFEYLELRFSRLVRVSGCALLIVQTLIYMAFLLYAPSLALNAVTGIDLWGSVVGMGFVVTFYTTLGGMKAVLWTDTFQALVIVAGLLAVLIEGSMLQGGFYKAWEIADERGRIVFDEYSFDPKTRHSVWSMIVGGWAFWMYLYGINQAQVQRCLSCPSIRKAQLAMLLSLPGLIFIVTVCCMIGIVMLAFYKDCHPISFGLVEKTDQLVPLYVMDILGDFPGVPGIFVSCVVSGSLSSLSSGLNALSAVTLRDLLEPTECIPKLNDFKTTIVSKGLVVFYGVLAMILAYGVSHLGSILQAVYIVFGILNGPLLGVFTLGIFYPWANKHGAFVGTFVSLAFLLWIGIAAYVKELKPPMSSFNTRLCNYTAKPTPTAPVTTTSNITAAPSTGNDDDDDDPFIDLYRMSYMYYTALGMILVHGVGLLVSFITGYTRPKTLDPKLICPIVDSLLPCLPESVKKVFRCGINHEGKYDEKEDCGVEIPEMPSPSDHKDKEQESVYNGNVGVDSVKPTTNGTQHHSNNGVDSDKPTTNGTQHHSNNSNNDTHHGDSSYSVENEKGLDNRGYNEDEGNGPVKTRL